jgi:hypothetical protein
MTSKTIKLYSLVLILATVLIITIIRNLEHPVVKNTFTKFVSIRDDIFYESNESNESKTWSKSKSKLDYVRTRDFIWHDCQNMKRIGGYAGYVKNAPNEHFRIDGAWFICLDDQLAPQKNNCNVFSFGVNHDYSFDEEMNKAWGCRTYSFDPIVEAKLFSDIRVAKSLGNSPEIRVNDKWVFYKLGISHRSSNMDLGKLKLGDILDFNMILKLTNLENKVIDVYKMDIEGGEKEIFDKLDMNYACKYVKQMVFETHTNFRFKNLEKFEQCFFMFHRNTRFFVGDSSSPLTGHLTEFQNPTGYRLNLASYFNETYLSEFMFVNGELYFMNSNFFNVL